MSDSHCSFSSLSFSDLFTDYTHDFQKVSSFYHVDPFFSDHMFATVAQHRSGILKGTYIDSLRSFHNDLGIAASQQDPLNKLSQENALAVVTGQQLGLFGGPLFTIYKTITAILTARTIEEKTGLPVVPVFWMGDEDHDFDEINWVGIPGYDTYHKISPIATGNGKTVAEQQVPENMVDFIDQVFAKLPETDFTPALKELLADCYAEGNTHAKAFAGLIHRLFEGQGLLIAGSNHASIKALTKSFFKTAILKNEELNDLLRSTSEEVAQPYHQQVQIGSTNLFYLHPVNGRLKIGLDEETGKWIVGEDAYKTDELLQLVDQHPDRFSPNVFLRPVLQDMLLPTVSYVAGPGELAYYAQMKKIYGVFEIDMPAITPRLSASIVESSIARNMEDLPFSVDEYKVRIEDLEASYIEQADTPDPEQIFGPWLRSIQDTSEQPVEKIGQIDPTLKAASEKVVAGISNEMNKLKGKVYRSIKQQEEVQLNRISKIRSQLFPDGLQERAVSPVYYMNKYGTDLPSKLLTHFEESGLDLRVHHLVEL